MWVVVHANYMVQTACSQLHIYIWVYWFNRQFVAFSTTHDLLTPKPNNRNDRCNITFTAFYFANNLTANWAHWSTVHWISSLHLHADTTVRLPFTGDFILFLWCHKERKDSNFFSSYFYKTLNNGLLELQTYYVAHYNKKKLPPTLTSTKPLGRERAFETSFRSSQTV